MTAILCLLVSTALSMSGASIHTSVQVVLHSYLPKFMVTTLHDKLLLYRLKWIFLVVVPCDRNLLARNTFFLVVSILCLLQSYYFCIAAMGWENWAYLDIGVVGRRTTDTA